MASWVKLLSCLPYWPMSLFAPELMLDLSLGPGQLPFFALAGRYYISEAPLSYFTFHIFTSSFIASMHIHQFEWYMCCLAFRFVLSHYDIVFQLLLRLFSLPPLPLLEVIPPSSSCLITHLHPLFFPRPRGVKLCAKTPVSQWMYLFGNSGALQ